MMDLRKKTGKNSAKPSRQKSAVPRTAQQSIPMQRMFEDGTCRVKNGYYTRTVEFQDINYQLALPEDRRKNSHRPLCTPHLPQVFR